MSWREHSSLRRLLGWFIAGVVVLVAADIVILGLGTTSQGLTSRNATSQRAMVLADQIPAHLDTLDASDRGFFLTRDPAFLVTARAAASQLRESTSELASLLPAGSPQAQSAAQLREEILDRLERSKGVAEMNSLGVPQSPDTLHEHALAIKAVEESSLAKRQAAVRLNGSIGALGFLAGTIFCLIVACVVVTRLAREAGELKTVQKDLETSRRSLEEIVANTTSAITVNDLDDRYTMVNDSALRFLGKKREEVIGKTVSDVLAGSLAPAVMDLLRRTRESGKVLELILEDAGADQSHAFSVVSIPMRDSEGEVFAVAVVSTDVTPIRQAQLHAESMHRLAEEAGLQADRANRAKTDFLSRMSHELRTPMNAILGFAQLLQAGKLTEIQHESVGHILRGGRHLLNLINDVLDISRIETSDFSLSREPIEVRPAVLEVCEMVAPIAAVRGVRVVDQTAVIEDACVLADGQRLRQILMNLISNAIKYGPQEGQVLITAQQEAGVMTMRVADEGGGIPDDKLDRLFTPFERFGAENSDIEGTGLGLALSRNLAEAMEGSLSYEPPSDGRPSSFVLQLPTAACPRLPDLPADRPQPEREPGLRVLYIEDNLPNVKLMEMVFDDYPSVKLLVAMRGQIGLDMSREEQPDLILLDLHLPDLDGVAILEELKKDRWMASVPVIVVSADATQKQIKRVMALGAHSYQTKPIQIDSLLVAVDAALASVGKSFLP